jgi:hypothetical protein
MVLNSFDISFNLTKNRISIIKDSLMLKLFSKISYFDKKTSKMIFIKKKKKF